MVDECGTRSAQPHALRLSLPSAVAYSCARQVYSQLEYLGDMYIHMQCLSAFRNSCASL